MKHWTWTYLPLIRQCPYPRTVCQLQTLLAARSSHRGHRICRNHPVHCKIIPHLNWATSLFFLFFLCFAFRFLLVDSYSACFCWQIAPSSISNKYGCWKKWQVNDTTAIPQQFSPAFAHIQFTSTVAHVWFSARYFWHDNPHCAFAISIIKAARSVFNFNWFAWNCAGKS